MDLPLISSSQNLFYGRISRLEDDSCMVTYVIQLDPGGWLPKCFVNRLNTKLVMIIENLRKQVQVQVQVQMQVQVQVYQFNCKVMGKITTKVDVFSYGVVLMELVTGLAALDEERPEECRYLAEWFWRIKSSKEKLMDAVDPTIDATEETFESISIVAELAGHCTAREPSRRPDMGHAVNVLSPLVEKWKPFEDETESYSGIDYSLPLPLKQGPKISTGQQRQYSSKASRIIITKNVLQHYHLYITFSALISALV